MSMIRSQRKDPQADPREDPGERAVIRLLTELVALNQAGLGEREIDLGQVAITDEERRTTILEDWPVAGGRRVIVSRPGYGSTVALPANVATQLLPAQIHRLGGYIVNAGANPVTLYGARQEIVSQGVMQVPQHYLPAGGSWNFLDGRTLWAGNLTAVSVLGTTVVFAEY